MWLHSTLRNVVGWRRGAVGLATLLVGLVVLSPASALNYAQSTGSVQAGRYSLDNAQYFPWAPGELSAQASYDKSDQSSYGEWHEQATSTASTWLMGGASAMGVVSVDAMVQVSNFPAQAVASAGATLRYEFEVKAKDPLQHPDVLQVPMTYAAFGLGEISSGSGLITGWATINVPGFDSRPCSFMYEGSATSRSFSGCAGSWWAPTTGATYVVTVSGTAQASNLAYPYGTAESQAAVNVDPIIAFDQAAFDASYGADSFDLASAYSIEYSPLPVPEPASAALLALGLATLTLRATSGRRAAATFLPTQDQRHETRPR